MSMFGRWFDKGKERERGDDDDADDNATLPQHAASHTLGRSSLSTRTKVGFEDDHSPRRQRAHTIDTNNRNNTVTEDSIAPRTGSGTGQLSSLISTPHDAVLASLSTPTNPPVHATKTIPERAPENAGDPSSATTTESSAALTRPEPLYDHFSGELLGMLAPEPPPTPSFEFEATKDDLWAHLTRVRSLQAEIAAMHVQMESLGAPQSDIRRKKTGGRLSMRRLSTGGSFGAGDYWGEDAGDEDEEAERKRATEAEFSQLADRFAGRKRDIEGIMGKLGELSDALTSFHALRTPVVTFNNNSRSNTQEATAAPPSTRSPLGSPSSPTSGFMGGSLYSGESEMTPYRRVLDSPPVMSSPLAEGFDLRTS